MEPLPTTKWMLTWMCMCPASEETSVRKKIAYKLCALTIFSVNLFDVIVLSAYIWKYAMTDFIGSLFTFIGVAAFTSSLYSMPIAYYLRHRAHGIFVRLAMIYDASKFIVSIPFCGFHSI